jgi:hypothetical protein
MSSSWEVSIAVSTLTPMLRVGVCMSYSRSHAPRGSEYFFFTCLCTLFGDMHSHRGRLERGYLFTITCSTSHSPHSFHPRSHALRGSVYLFLAPMLCVGVYISFLVLCMHSQAGAWERGKNGFTRAALYIIKIS